MANSLAPSKFEDLAKDMLKSMGKWLPEEKFNPIYEYYVRFNENNSFDKEWGTKLSESLENL